MYIDGKFQLFMKILNGFFFDSNDGVNKQAKTQNYIKNESDIQDNYNHYLFLCRKCHQIPMITFTENYLINLECDCSHYINIDINHIIEDYMVDEQSNNKISNNCKCKRHSLKYYAYCDDCSNDICEQCLSKEEELHSTHTLLIFPNIYEKCKNILDYVTQKKKEIFEEEIIILEIFNAILDDYRNFPSYTCYHNMYNCISFLNKLNENEKEFNYKENKKMEYYIKIRNIRDLKNIINNNPSTINIIESININSQNFYDLNLFKLNNKLPNYAQLISLDLKQNNISDIKPLSSIAFPQLEELDLSNNRLSDEAIDIIKNLICPKLKKLNLSSNAFTKYEIFECCKNFKQLKVFYIGYNKMDKNLKNNKNKDFNYEFQFPQTLEELGLSNGVFSKKSINIIKYFKFDNLKKLFLCSNNLNSLSFLEKIKFEKLEEFWLTNNNLKEYETLKPFKKLKVINLQKNKIKNISNLCEFLKEFPYIEKVIFINNNIDLDDFENEKIINKAKKHRNSSNDKIQIFF